MKKAVLRIEIENRGYNLAGFDLFTREFPSELKRVKYRDLEDMVHRLQLTYAENIDILNVKKIGGSTIGCALPPVYMKIVIAA